MAKQTTANTTILFVIAGLVIFALGIGIGIFYQTRIQLSNPAIQKAVQIQPTVNILTSKVVQSITAFGSVEKIDGKNLTLTYGGDQITVNISANAQIYSSTPTTNAKTGNLISGVPQLVSFGTIKIGDQLTVNLQILPNGQLQANSIYILIPS
jgi:hypothetical protein